MSYKRHESELSKIKHLRMPFRMVKAPFPMRDANVAAQHWPFRITESRIQPAKRSQRA
jgi:hypothetical protein